MGVINTIKNNMKEKRLKRLGFDLREINNRINLNFNPFNISGVLHLENDINFSQRLQENYTWYTANVPALMEFYREHREITSKYYKDDYNYFWANVPQENRKVHTKVPSLITLKMVDLLIGNGYNFDASVSSYDENGEEIEEQELTESVKSRMMNIIDENKFSSLLSNSISAESWSGGVAWKIIVDKDFSNLPILQKADQRYINLHTKYGRIVGIGFKEYYQEGKINYVLYETYTTNENGDATIINKLYRVDNKGKETEVSLNEISQTKELEEEITFNGFKGMLAFYKPNKLPNTEFLGSPYGESDYAGCYSLFDSLDEILSTMIDDVRKNRTRLLVPETLLPTNKNGDRLPLDEFKMNYIKVSGSDAADEGANKIETYNAQSRINEYIENWKTTLLQTLNTSGLSAISFGITGLDAVNSSEKSQREREKASLRTRKTKEKLWQEFFGELLPQLFKAYIYLNLEDKSEIGNLKDLYLKQENYNLDFDLIFEEYIIQPLEERLMAFAQARSGNQIAISIENMVRQIYGSVWNENQIREEIDKIKMEMNMTIDDADRDLLAD